MAKTAIVTGASRGIGHSIAKRLASDGFAVVVNYAGKADEAQKVVNEIRAADGEAIDIKADVSKPEDVKQLFDKTIETFGRVDVVVNNAGIMPLSPIAKGDVETFDKVISTNLRGTFLVLRRQLNTWPKADASSPSRAACWRNPSQRMAPISLPRLVLKGSFLYWQMSCADAASR